MLSMRARTLDFIAPVDVFLSFFKIAICDVHTKKYQKRPPRNLPHTFPKAANSMNNLNKSASKRDFERRCDIKAQNIDKKRKKKNTLGSILEGFGRLLGATWTLLGASWTLLGRLWNALGRLLGTSWVSWAPLERFFGSWEDLGDGFGGVLEGVGASKLLTPGKV